MTTLADLTPGTIGFTRLSGLARPFVWLGQKIVDATSPEESPWQHVFVVTQAAGAERPYRDPVKAVEAMPGGAREVMIGTSRWTSDFMYIRPDYLEITEQALSVASMARAYVGTPYSFLDYLAIAGLHAGVKNGPIRRYVKSSKHMICSQLADQAMSDAGWHVFDDGRLPQDVTPAALYRQMMIMPGQHFRPGFSDDWVENKVRR